MGFQFVHIESYGRKADKSGRNTAFVLDEAERRPEACQHVEHPAPPVVVHGLSVAKVRALHDARAAEAVATTKTGKARKVRMDQHTLMTAVASFPAAMDEVRTDPAKADEFAEWERRTIAWMSDRWGDQLVSVLRHEDEAHPHLHAYVLPDDPEMRARQHHPGVRAKAEAKASAEAEGLDGKASNAEGDMAYKEAMRRVQDDYWQAVGLPCGLTRLGPGRRRLTRAAWKVEQAQVEHAARVLATVSDAEARKSGIDERANAAIVRARATVKRATALLGQAEEQRGAAEDAERASRREAAARVRAARREAAMLLEKADQRAARLRSVGSRLGGLWSGLTGVQRRLEARASERVRLAEDRARAAVATALANAMAESGGELSKARRSAAAANAILKAAELRVGEAERELAAERAARQKAECERDDFRIKWAEADNKNQRSASLTSVRRSDVRPFI